MLPEEKPTEGDERQGLPSRFWTLLFALALVGLASIAGYYRLYSTFALYDDEGYVLLSLRQYTAGLALYDEVYSQYGPGFFQITAPLHRWTGLPLTTDAVRLKALILWMLCAGLSSWLIFRLSNSRMLSASAFLMVFLQLEKTALEPGHPQELCAVLIAATVLLSTYWQAGSRGRYAIIATGVLVALLTTIKPNLGIFLAAAVAIGLTLSVENKPGSGWIRNIILWSPVALPFLLLRSSLGDPSFYWLITSVTLGVVGVLLVDHTSVPRPSRARDTPWRRALLYPLAAGLAVIAILGFSLVAGTSAKGLVHGILLQHLDFGNRAHIPLGSHLALTGAGVALALLAVLALRQDRLRTGMQLTIGLALILPPLLVHLSEAKLPLTSGLVDRGFGQPLIALAGPLLWLVMFPGSGGAGRALRPGFATLASAAALQPLGIYPIPGGQVAIASFLTLLVALLIVHQGASILKRRGVPAGILLAIALSAVGFRAVTLPAERAQLVPLLLPGADRLHVAPEVAETLHWMVSSLQDRTDVFISGPRALNSLYLWTEMQPPNGFNATLWPIMLNHEEQESVVSALGRHPRVGAIWQAGALPTEWQNDPMFRFATNDLVPVSRHGNFELRLPPRSAGEMP